MSVKSGLPEATPQPAPADAPKAGIGAPTSRIDARTKVTGQARYGSDFDGGRQPAHAYLATSRIARGAITSIDQTAARAVPGVLEILTWQNVGDRVKPGGIMSDKGYMGSSIAPLASARIQYSGQIVAVVVADSFEAAREAAERLDIVYVKETPSASFDSPGTMSGFAHPKPPGGDGGDEMPKVGDAEGAFSAGTVKIDQHYETPIQHHNPIELFTTTASWTNGKLTVRESSQNVYGFQNGLAEQLGIPASDIRVISPYIGGAFGSRGSLTQRTALIALAANMTGRPVRLETSRSQGFTIATYRAETRHHIRLAADRNGKLQALIHEGFEISSRPDDYKVAGVDASTRLYACPNVGSNVTIVHADRNTPGFMRAPPELPYLFALESAMDELAVALQMDPVELRRVNDTMHEPIKGLRYTSRALMPCFDAAAAKFGWYKRTPVPGSMRDGDWLIGWGCASTMYPTQMGAASARVTMTPQGTVKVQTASHEIGQGVYTVVALTAVQELGVSLDKVSVELGDTDLPPAPGSGGSNSTASVCNVVAKACREIRDRITAAAVAAPGGAFHRSDPKTLTLSDGTLRDTSGRSEPLSAALSRASAGAIEAYAENIPHGVPADGAKGLYKGQSKLVGGAR